MTPLSRTRRPLALLGTSMLVASATVFGALSAQADPGGVPPALPGAVDKVAYAALGDSYAAGFGGGAYYLDVTPVPPEPERLRSADRERSWNRARRAARLRRRDRGRGCRDATVRTGPSHEVRQPHGGRERPRTRRGDRGLPRRNARGMRGGDPTGGGEPPGPGGRPRRDARSHSHRGSQGDHCGDRIPAAARCHAPTGSPGECRRDRAEQRDQRRSWAPPATASSTSMWSEHSPDTASVPRIRGSSPRPLRTRSTRTLAGHLAYADALRAVE